MKSQRDRDLASIHIAVKQLGMDREAYEDILWTIARVRSAADLDAHGRQAVKDHMKACGARFTKTRRTTPPASKDARVAKIRAYLATAKRPDAYADSMAKRMFGVDRFEWCTGEQLSRIIAALNYDAKRHGRPR